MKLKKNNLIAAELRLIGNEHYKSLQFYKALLYYNKSLCHAIPSSVDFALCFANRSAVYFEIEEYDACVENIQLAIDFGYPRDKVVKLMERHERCEELIGCYKKNPLENPWNFFKLSHPTNKKIPYIVDCIEQRESKKYGRHLITTKRLYAGDVIAIERPFYKYILNTSRFTNCANCLKSEKLNLFPCCKCNYTMFCSHECMSKGQRFHHFECDIDINIEKEESSIFNVNHRVVFEALGIFKKIRKLKSFLVQNVNSEPKTIFDYDLSNETANFNEIEKNILLAIHSLQRNPIRKELEPLMEQHCKLMMSITKNENHKKFLNEFMRHQMEIIITNSFGLIENEKEIGSGIFPFASYFNHSCAPNVCRITVDGRLIFIVTRPIEKNQQLFVCYRENFFNTNLKERQKEILESYRFTCTCEACLKNYAKLNELPRYDKNLKISAKKSSSLKAILSEYKDNCAYINENFNIYPSYEICRLIGRNHQLLNCYICITTFCVKPNK